MRSALITGILGQDGFYLSRLLLDKGYRVFGLVRPDSAETERLHVDLARVAAVEGDLRDETSLIAALHASEPDEVYNLAGPSFKPSSRRRPVEAVDVLGIGVLRLLDAIRETAPRGIRFVQASSSEMFGDPAVSPQDESTPLRPSDPYAVGKSFAHNLVGMYRDLFGVHASAAICYNHESPRRRPEFVTRSISRGVARIAAGLAEDLTVGSLTSARDWGFAGDYVEAMWLMTQQERPADYVIATGETHTVGDFCRVAFAAIGVDGWESRVVLDPELSHSNDTVPLVGDITKASRLLGWRPMVSFEELVDMMVRHDLELLHASSA
ncbi:MAG: GDP-mannose 4,6-dehydratase [Actinomycetota bacterium]